MRNARKTEIGENMTTNEKVKNRCGELKSGSNSK